MDSTKTALIPILLQLLTALQKEGVSVTRANYFGLGRADVVLGVKLSLADLYSAESYPTVRTFPVDGVQHPDAGAELPLTPDSDEIQDLEADAERESSSILQRLKL